MGKLVSLHVVLLKVAEPVDDVMWELNVLCRTLYKLNNSDVPSPICVLLSFLIFIGSESFQGEKGKI